MYYSKYFKVGVATLGFVSFSIIGVLYDHFWRGNQSDFYGLIVEPVIGKSCFHVFSNSLMFCAFFIFSNESSWVIFCISLNPRACLG